MAKAIGWARAWAIARPESEPTLRQGAWYPVIKERESDLVLRVLDEDVTIPRRLVELRDERPERFTVVYRAKDDPNPVRGKKTDRGRVYAVCPMCGHRVWLVGKEATTRCTECHHEGEVAWWETG
jgi:hypothetical protein